MNDIAIVVVLVIGAIAAGAGIGLGIVFIAPRISRALDRADNDDEEHGDRPA